MTKSTYQTSKIFDLELFGSSKASLLSLLAAHLKEEKSLLTLVTPNPEHIVQSRNDQRFLHHLQSADLRLPDGIGLVIASRLLHFFKGTEGVAERIAGVEVVEDMLQTAKEQGYSVLVIGGRGYGAAEASVPAQLAKLGVQQLASLGQDTTTNTHQFFWLEGYKDVKNPQPSEESQLAAALQELQPEIVFVALGAPFQEEWLISHRELLKKSHVKLAMVVGGAFDILLNLIPRAPHWMRSLGLEWLYRLWQEPWRWRRQLKLLEFVKITFQEL